MSKIPEQEKISFDIVSLYEGNSPRVIELLVTDKQGRTTFINNSGHRNDREPTGGDSIASYQLASINDQKKVFHRVSYYPEKYEKDIDYNERANNLIARHAHELLKRHPSVFVRGENGGNENPNQSSIMLFELVETSKNIREERERNKLITKARFLVDDMMDNDQNGFINFCYRYGIQPIQGVAIEKIYNEVMLKINNNPKHFFTILEHKDAKLYSAIKKAMIEGVNGTAHIYWQEPYFMFNGEILGTNDEEIIHFFNNKPKDRAVLYQTLGMPADDVNEVVSLPADSDGIALSKTQTDFKRRVDGARLEEMKKKVGDAFKVFVLNKGKNENAERILDEKIEELREIYADIQEAFDAHVADKYQRIRK